MRSKPVCAALLCLLVISIAGFGPGQLTTQQAQARLDALFGEGVVEVRGIRQVSEERAIARVAFVVEGAEIDVPFVLAGWRIEDEIEIDGRVLPVVALAEAMQLNKQRLTMASMRSIATANGTMRVDIGRYANYLLELKEKDYLSSTLTEDGWGNAFVYATGADTYTLVSLGSDSAAGPAPPASWPGAPFEPDIVLTDGRFTQAPTGR